MLWVVLYCSVRWLLHDLSPEETRNLLNNVFDQSSLWEGRPSGGGEKDSNATRRKWTERISFQCPALGEWLNVFMDCHNRSIRDRRQRSYEGWWQRPLQMEQWWGEFLQTHALSPSDRSDRHLKHASHQLEHDSLAPIVSATMHKRSDTKSKRPRSPSNKSWMPVQGLGDALPYVGLTCTGDDNSDDLDPPPPMKKPKSRTTRTTSGGASW